MKDKYKLGIKQRADIEAMIKEGKTQNQIVDHIKSTYNIDITQSYISQMKQKLTYKELTVYNKDLERKLRSRIKVDSHIMKILERGYNTLSTYIENTNNRELNLREIQVINNIVHNAHRLYSEIHKGEDNKKRIDYNIKKALGF